MIKKSSNLPFVIQLLSFFLIIGFVIWMIKFILTHPKFIFITLIASAFLIFTQPVANKISDVLLTTTIDENKINVRHDPATPENIKIDKDICVKTVDEAIKAGKVELYSKNSFEYVQGDSFKWTQYIPAYELITISSNYLTNKQLNSFMDKNNPYKIVLAYSLQDILQNNKFNPKNHSANLFGRNYYIDTNKKIIYTWCFEYSYIRYLPTIYETAKYTNGEYELSFLADWLTISYPNEISLLNSQDWKDLYGNNIEIYNRSAITGVDWIDFFASAPNSNISSAHFLAKYLVNKPYCEKCYPDEIKFIEEENAFADVLSYNNTVSNIRSLEKKNSDYELAKTKVHNRMITLCKKETYITAFIMIIISILCFITGKNIISAKKLNRDCYF